VADGKEERRRRLGWLDESGKDLEVLVAEGLEGATWPGGVAGGDAEAEPFV
jgi:hypothetical protein